MKVFLDTNVLMDSLLDNRPHHEEASLILSASESGIIEGCVSCLTFANMAYAMRKDVGKDKMKEILRKSMALFDVLPMDYSQMLAALDVEAPDFEDVLQYECAKAAECEIIVSSNIRHFKFCKDIEVVATVDYARQFME